MTTYETIFFTRLGGALTVHEKNVVMETLYIISQATKIDLQSISPDDYLLGLFGRFDQLAGCAPILMQIIQKESFDIKYNIDFNKVKNPDYYEDMTVIEFIGNILNLSHFPNFESDHD